MTTGNVGAAAPGALSAVSRRTTVLSVEVDTTSNLATTPASTVQGIARSACPTTAAPPATNPIATHPGSATATISFSKTLHRSVNFAQQTANCAHPTALVPSALARTETPRVCATAKPTTTRWPMSLTVSLVHPNVHSVGLTPSRPVCVNRAEATQPTEMSLIHASATDSISKPMSRTSKTLLVCFVQVSARSAE